MSQVFQVRTVWTRTSRQHATAQIKSHIPPHLELPIPKIPPPESENNESRIACSSRGNEIEISDPIFTVC